MKEDNRTGWGRWIAIVALDCGTGGRALHAELSAAPFLLGLPMLTAWIALHGTEGNERLRKQGT